MYISIKRYITVVCTCTYMHICIYTSVVCTVKSSVVHVSSADKAGLIIGYSCFPFGFLLLLSPNVKW